MPKLVLVLSFSLLSWLGVLHCQSNSPLQSSFLEKPVKGLTLVAPPKPFPTDPTHEIQSIGANCIAIIPYAFTPPQQALVRFGSKRQWWGERPEGIRKSIELAQKRGIHVLLKPQVWSPGWWTGDYSFSTDDEWSTWEEQYASYITHFAEIAEKMEVEAFCLGTEFKTAIRERPQFWQNLIKRIRTIYSGRLTYAANWDNFENIPFWDQLDYIGINAYFPLSSEQTPTVSELVSAWKPMKKKIADHQSQYGLPVIFTEYGYLSVDRCADKTWELEASIGQLAINEPAQANAIDALHTAFASEHYWKGGFLWKWFPNMQGHEGYPEKDYTPQGKMSEKILESWFKK